MTLLLPSFFIFVFQHQKILDVSFPSLLAHSCSLLHFFKEIAYRYHVMFVEKKIKNFTRHLRGLNAKEIDIALLHVHKYAFMHCHTRRRRCVTLVRITRICRERERQSSSFRKFLCTSEPAKNRVTFIMGRLQCAANKDYN